MKSQTTIGLKYKNVWLFAQKCARDQYSIVLKWKSKGILTLDYLFLWLFFLTILTILYT